jgi:hypothetical protein
MDTSRDYSSPTYDFVMGKGVNLPRPSYHDYSHIIMGVGEKIESNGLLNDVIGYRTVDTDSHLKKAIEQLAPADATDDESPYGKLRARSIFSLDHGSGERHTVIKFYLGTLKSQLTWIFLHAYDSQSSRSGEIITCTMPDARGMAKLFFDYQYLAEGKIAQLVLHGLKSNVDLEVKRRHEKLHSFNETLDFINNVVRLDESANIPRQRD